MIGLELVGDKEVQASLGKLGGSIKNLTPLHKRFGIAGRKWIAETFKVEGRPRWRPLSKNTIAARRKGSSKVLQDKGLLRASYDYHATRQLVRLGTTKKIALLHQKGTKPYEIIPKKLGGVLAFMAADGLVFTRRVRHPGLVARPMLPTKAQAAKDVLRPVTDIYLQEQIRKMEKS